METTTETTTPEFTPTESNPVRFKIAKNRMIQVIEAMKLVVPKRGLDPILENLCFTPTGIIGANWGKRAVYAVPFPGIPDELQVCIPYQTLSDIVKTMPDGNYIDFQSVPDSLSMKITAGQMEHDLSVSYYNDKFRFSIETGECLKRVTINGKELQPFLFFASKDDSVPYKEGLHFNMRTGEIAGTDAHRLFVLKAPEMQTGADFGFTVYAKDLKLIAGYQNCPTEIYAEYVVFRPTPFLSYACSLNDSRYPDYNAVIPRDNPHTATYNVQELITGIKQVLPACNINTFQVNFSMHSGQIVGMDADLKNEAKTVVNCISNTGESETIGFNAKYLMEILNCLKPFGNVTIRYSTPNRAVLIESEMRKDLTILLMPCLIK